MLLRLRQRACSSSTQNYVHQRRAKQSSSTEIKLSGSKEGAPSDKDSVTSKRTVEVTMLDRPQQLPHVDFASGKLCAQRLVFPAAAEFDGVGELRTRERFVLCQHSRSCTSERIHRRTSAQRAQTGRSMAKPATQGIGDRHVWLNFGSASVATCKKCFQQDPNRRMFETHNIDHNSRHFRFWTDRNSFLRA